MPCAAQGKDTDTTDVLRRQPHRAVRQRTDTVRQTIESSRLRLKCSKSLIETVGMQDKEGDAGLGKDMRTFECRQVGESLSSIYPRGPHHRRQRCRTSRVQVAGCQCNMCSTLGVQVAGWSLQCVRYVREAEWSLQHGHHDKGASGRTTSATCAVRQGARGRTVSATCAAHQGCRWQTSGCRSYGRP